VRVAQSVAWRASQRRGVACVAAWGRWGDEGEGEKAAVATQGESGRRLREGGVLPY
jgi:hypothetical protein